MKAAIDEVEGGKSMNSAAKELGVGRLSISSRVKGTLKRGTQEHCQGLTKEEEKGLADFLITMGQRSLPLTRVEVASLVVKLPNERGEHSFKETGPSKKTTPKSHEEARGASIQPIPGNEGFD